ncbi:hypothetical protein TSUD_106320 [Trifolium subterraneum]|uniref:Uncharacterized protein n=1 Tax=Trifolium subterraneum TaxID=3900 RepID=A0A2Z6LIR1_TRISU|nr:hypothetical protein TSUD_106320 [Trifolium subterraneum]
MEWESDTSEGGVASFVDKILHTVTAGDIVLSLGADHVMAGDEITELHGPAGDDANRTMWRAMGGYVTAGSVFGTRQRRMQAC